MQKNSLEISCYVCGAGAFGVFFRWLQDQLAFDDAGLAEKSAWNLLVPALIIICALLFLRFVDNARNHRYYLPDDFCEALSNKGKLFTLMRWLAGAIMIAGGVLLLAKCETDTEAAFLQVLSGLGILSGIAFPLLLTSANDPEANSSLRCLYAFMPILLFSVWLVTTYKMNDTNPVIWEYAIEIVAVILAINGFFRVAGFAYGVANPWRAMFFSMMGAFACIMTLADERYMGMHLMLFGAALQLILYNWIMVKNLKRREAAPKVQPDDGFERL